MYHLITALFKFFAQVPVKLSEGVTDEHCKVICESLGFSQSKLEKVSAEIKNLYNLFVSTDATQIEINPLVETSTGDIMCLDAKLNFDDNAAFRQQEIFKLRDFSQEDDREVKASKYDLNFIGLDGTIGCLGLWLQNKKSLSAITFF